jgi:Zn-dependent peptidase ImmA (M78 family)/transcriptional regulator with XRE-family HTH domain
MSATSQPLPCFECDGTLQRVLRPQKTQLPDFGEVTVPDVPVLTCPKCGDTVLGAEGSRYMDAWLNKYTGALTPEELRQFLEQYGLTHKQAAAITGYGEKNISRWLAGKMRPTVSVSNFFRLLIADRSAFETLKSRQWGAGAAVSYPTEEKQPDKREKAILKQIDFASLVQIGFVSSTRSSQEQRTALCRRFEVPDLLTLGKKADDNLLAMAAYKDTSQKFSRISGGLWMELGCRAAERIQVKPYDRDKLAVAVKELRELTQTKLVDVIPQVRQILADAGVALVFAPIMKQSAFRGCTRLMSPTKAVIIHSMKYRNLAQFWLILFHEIAHLMLHITDVKDVFAEYEVRKDAPQEKQADEWAQDTLVYSDKLITFSARCPKPTPEQIEAFAREVKVHTAIAAEVFNKRAKADVIPYSRLNQLGLFPSLSEEDAAFLWKNNPLEAAG